MNVASRGCHALIGMGLAVCLCLSPICAGDLETNASVGQGASQTSDLFPDITVSRTAVWIAVWQTSDELAEDSDAGIGADLDIVFVRSVDGGLTWSRPRPLSPAAAADSGGDFMARLATDSKGNWVCVWISTDSLGGRIGTDTDVVISRSEDDGRTWSAPEPVLLNAQTDDSRGADLSPAIAFGGGTFLIAYEVFGGFGPDADLVVLRSADAGLGWGDPISVKSTPAEDWAADFSPRLASDGRGNWFCVWWSDNLVSEPYPSGPSRPFAILGSFSSDDGATWTPPEPISAGADLGPDQRFASVVYAGDRWSVVWESVRHVGAAPQNSNLSLNGAGGLAATSARAQESELGIFLSSSTGAAGDWTRPERIAPGDGTSDPVSSPVLDSSGAAVLRFPVIATSSDGRSVVAWESTSADSGSRIQCLALSDGDDDRAHGIDDDGDHDGDSQGASDSNHPEIVDLTAALGAEASGIRFMNPSIDADGDTWLVIWESYLPGDSGEPSGQGGQGVPTGSGEPDEPPDADIRHVYAARSSDGARTWSAPFRLD